MIDQKPSGEFIMSCNRCEAEEVFETDDFMAMVALAKAAGWKIRKDGDEWVHTCPSCGK